MQVYIYMGTHLVELENAIDAIVDASPEKEFPALVYLPAGLEWTPGDASYTVSHYDPESILWVLDPDQDQACHIIVDPRAPLIPQLEKLADNLRKCLIEPVKVVTCVDCEQAESSTKLRNWLDACVYYSDIVLLGNRSGASKPFVRDFQKQYERLCYPCLFMFMKGRGSPADPAEILTFGTRRLSQMFELNESTNISKPDGYVIESSCDLDLQETETDPYRTPSEDQSARHVPDPGEFVVTPVKED